MDDLADGLAFGVFEYLLTLKGVGFEPMWPKFLALLLLGVALLGFSTLRFKRTAVEE